MDGSYLVSAFVVSSIGFVLLYYGRKQARVPHLAVGAMLLMFPFFVDGVVPVLVTTAALLGGLGAAVYLGW